MLQGSCHTSAPPARRRCASPRRPSSRSCAHSSTSRWGGTRSCARTPSSRRGRRRRPRPAALLLHRRLRLLLLRARLHPPQLPQPRPRLTLPRPLLLLQHQLLPRLLPQRRQQSPSSLARRHLASTLRAAPLASSSRAMGARPAASTGQHKRVAASTWFLLLDMCLPSRWLRSIGRTRILCPLPVCATFPGASCFPVTPPPPRYVSGTGRQHTVKRSQCHHPHKLAPLP